MNDIATNTLDGGLGLTDPVYAVSNLSSLFTVCALALNGVGEYREDIRERALKCACSRSDVTGFFGPLITENNVARIC